MRIIPSLLLCAGLAVPLVALAAPAPAPADARVYIISPLDGSTVGETFTVRFGLSGMGIAPAGVERDGTGHHHLLIDMDTLPEAGKPIPTDAQHLHFGGGQTEAVLQLEPGTHTLQLHLGDANHVPFAPPVMSPKITVHVRAAGGEDAAP